MTKTIEIIGDKKLRARINELAKKAPKKIDRILFKAALNTHRIAIFSIQQGPKTGRSYKRGGKTHIASAPGEAPATDSGELVRNITIEKDAIMDYTVGSREAAPQGFWMEFGTSRVEARPWLTPAARLARKQLQKDLRTIK